MLPSRGPRERWHDVAQVCLNGHMVNDSTIAQPDFSSNYCPKCGAKTITTCANCEAPIQGDYHSSVAFIGPAMKPVPFCRECGHAYPWTERSLEAARELARELEGLNDHEREQLEKSLDDLVVDVAMTKVSAGRAKRLLAKAGPAAAESFRELLIGVMSEAAKKAMFGL